MLAPGEFQEDAEYLVATLLKVQPGPELHVPLAELREEGARLTKTAREGPLAVERAGPSGIPYGPPGGFSRRGGPPDASPVLPGHAADKIRRPRQEETVQPSYEVPGGTRDLYGFPPSNLPDTSVEAVCREFVGAGAGAPWCLCSGGPVPPGECVPGSSSLGVSLSLPLTHAGPG